MVFEYLADNLHNVIFTRPKRRLEKEEVKRVTKVILKGLVTMHEEGVAHTGIFMKTKPPFSSSQPTVALLNQLQISNPTT